MTKRRGVMVAAGAFILGGVCAYFLDPERGRRRRAVRRDRARHALHALANAADVTVRDISNRIHGRIAEARSDKNPEARRHRSEFRQRHWSPVRPACRSPGRRSRARVF